MLRVCFITILILWSAVSTRAAAPASDGLSAMLHADQHSHPEFLPPDQAFRLSATAVGERHLRLTWVVAPGYYIYRDHIHVSVDASPEKGGETQLGHPHWPAGAVRSDEYFGRQVIFREVVDVDWPITRRPHAAVELPLLVSYQGCAEAGLCYPPIQERLVVRLGASN